MTRVQKNVRMMMKTTKSPSPPQVRVLYTHTHIHTLSCAHTHCRTHTHTQHTHIWGSFYLLYLIQSYVLFILAAFFYSSRTFYSFSLLISIPAVRFIH